MPLFVLSGIGNGSTYKMIPAIFRSQALQTVADGGDPEAAERKALRMSGALIGIAGAIGAFGGVLVNLAFRQSFLTTGTATPPTSSSSPSTWSASPSPGSSTSARRRCTRSETGRRSRRRDGPRSVGARWHDGRMAIEVRAASVFDDVATMVGPKRPDATVCWCLSYRLTSSKENLALQRARPR